MPVECFRIRVDVHQRPGSGLWCYSIEISDPHTQELYAKVLDPARSGSTAAHRTSLITTDLRGVLLELTDPDPF